MQHSKRFFSSESLGDSDRQDNCMQYVVDAIPTLERHLFTNVCFKSKCNKIHLDMYVCKSIFQNSLRHKDRFLINIDKNIDLVCKIFI